MKNLPVQLSSWPIHNMTSTWHHLCPGFCSSSHVKWELQFKMLLILGLWNNVNTYHF